MNELFPGFPDTASSKPKPRRRSLTAPDCVAWVTVQRIAETPGMKLIQPNEAASYWQEHIASRADHDPDKEHLYALMIDTKHQVRAASLVSMGSLNESVAAPREIFRAAVATAAYGIVLMHNHPSTDPNPSEADRRLTARLVECGKILAVQIIDHVIYGAPGRYFSFREAGLI